MRRMYLIRALQPLKVTPARQATEETSLELKTWTQNNPQG